MANNTKKYISITRLSDFLDNLKGIFLSKSDYIVDDALSPTSSNPVQNKILDAEFESISQGMNALELSIDTHNHDDKYYTESEINTKIEEINGSIEGKADLAHNHIVADISDLEDALNQKVSINRTINGKALNEDVVLTAADVGADPVDSASSALESAKEYANNLANTKADVVHTHNDMYYTESEIDVKVSELNAFVTDNYETKLDAETKLAEAKAYTDNVKNDLLNGAGAAYDTLKELGDLIDDNTDAIDALERVATGKSDKGHVHEISEVTNLPETLNTIEQNILQKTQVQIIAWEADD